MRSILLTLLVGFAFSPFCLRAQCLTNTNFRTASCPIIWTGAGPCPTWSGSCNGWQISHGSPNLQTTQQTTSNGTTFNEQDVFMWADYSQGEGIFTGYTFQTGQIYNLEIRFSSSCTQAGGHVYVFAMNGLSGHPPTDCGNGYPNPSSGQLVYEYDGNSNSSTVVQSVTFTANNNYSQLWVYPSAYGTSSIVKGPSEYMMFLYDIFVCTACSNQLIYNTGTVPSGTTTAATVEIGSSAGTGGSGTVTNVSGQNTVVTASQSIQLLKNFYATNAGGGSFLAQISPCNPSNPKVYLTSPDPIDSATANQWQPESEGKTTITSNEGAVFSNPAPAKLQLYPTVSKGSVTITGSASDLANSNILVADESGRPVYRLFNAAATTINLDLTRFGNGIYFVHISNQSGSSTQKIVISK